MRVDEEIRMRVRLEREQLDISLLERLIPWGRGFIHGKRVLAHLVTIDGIGDKVD
jgi:hypothetical protein